MQQTIAMLEEYQQFWVNEFSGETEQQLVVDWDSFITSFGRVVAGQGHYTLNSIQKDYVRTRIDPQNAGHIHKNAFLLFCRDYWDIPSNRNNLLKMKMNLSQALPRLALLTTEPQKSLLLTILSPHHPRKRYELQRDVFHQLNQEGFSVQEWPLKQKDFLRVGSDERCEIVIDNLPINRQHIKIIALSKEKVKLKKPQYAWQENNKQHETQHETEWFIRDIARSNRSRYALDTPSKYVVAKPRMVVGFGLTGQYQLIITGVGPNLTDLIIQQKQIQQLEGLLNADRINFLGQVDNSIPLKSVVSFNYRTITAKQIDQLYQEGAYYPPPPPAAKPTKKKELPTLKFFIRNLVTGWQKDYLMDTAFTVGRAECTVSLGDFSMRPSELSFSLLNGVWLLRNTEKFAQIDWDIGIPGIYLPGQTAISNRQSSNRVKLKAGHQYVIQGKQLQLRLQVRQNSEDKQQ